MPVDRLGYGSLTYGAGDFGTEGVTHDGLATVTATASATADGGISKFAGASTSVTSTVTTDAVRYREASATVNASASVTASGEGVIIERTDEFSYGMGVYGANEYTQGDLQTVATATSSTTAVGEKILLASATVTSTSGTTANARRVPEGSALVNGASTTAINTTANGTRVREGDATPSALASFVADSFRKRTSGATSSSSAVGTASGVFIVSGDATGTLQATVTAVCNRVQHDSGSLAGTSTTTATGYATRGLPIQINGVATNTSDSEKIFQGVATASSVCVFSATCNRVQHSGSVIAGDSGIMAVGREKWEVLSSASTTWTPKSQASTTWTDLVA